MEPRVTRRAGARLTLAELAERLTRVETTVEHLQETLIRIDLALSRMQQKIDTLAASMAQGIGGLRVGVVVGQVVAAALGFAAARLWPMGK